MLGSSLLIFTGIGLLYLGAEGLVRGSAAIAARMGLTPLVIGLTVVAFGTSMPEMVVSVGATLTGNGPIAIGNVVGSNIGNIGLILGTSALVRPLAVHSQIVRVDVPLLILVSLGLVLLFGNNHLNRMEGLFLLVGLLLYLGMSLRVARRESEEVQEEFAEATPRGPRAPLLDVLFVLGGLALLVLGARLLVAGAVAIAQGLGISDAIIGLTIVAIGTSLPELATSLVASSRGEGDIAIGNAVGSNLFNVLGILGVTSLVRPIQGLGISGVDLTVMVGFAVVLLPLVYSGSRLNRWEGGALLAAYVAYLFYLIP